MPTHTKILSYQNEAGLITISRTATTAELSQNVEVEVATGATVAEIDLSIPASTLKSIAFGVTKKTGQASALVAGPLTLKSNSSSEPDDTIVVKTTNGVMWAFGDDATANPKPINTTVTKFYVANPGDGIAILVIKILNDPTP